MNLSDDTVEMAADLLVEARLRAAALPELPEHCRPLSMADAYAIQAAGHRHPGAADWGGISGHKIGCTTTVMQQYLKIDQPCAGGVFDETVMIGEGHVERSALCRPGVECEIAVRLSADLPRRAGGHDHASVGDAVAAVMASIELVDDRWEDFSRVSMPSLLAGAFFNAGCVLGEEVADWQGLDLAALAGRMLINGEEAGKGVGGDALGHPLVPLAWLANNLNQRGIMLRAGDVVLTGSIVATKWLRPGDHMVTEVEGLGRASLTVT